MYHLNKKRKSELAMIAFPKSNKSPLKAEMTAKEGKRQEIVLDLNVERDCMNKVDQKPDQRVSDDEKYISESINQGIKSVSVW